MLNGAPRASELPAYRMLRELGARAHPTFASLREPRELLVVVRFGRPLPSTAIASIVQEADSLAKNWHPNIARVRHVDADTDEVAIGSELVEGATLADLLSTARARTEPLPLPVVIRIVLDVLAGLHALHGLRDATNRRMGTIHGELCPSNIVVGRDGVARIIHTLRPRPVAITERSEGLGHAAPETLEGGVTDTRADVYAVGVILWEALMGTPLFPEADPARILHRQRAEEIPAPTPPPELAFLGAVAMRALSFEPGLRFRTAAEMGAEIRRPTSAQIASGSVVAAWVANLDGDRIRGRRNALDPSASGQRKRPTDGEIAAKLAEQDAEKPATPTAPTLPPGSLAEPTFDVDKAWEAPPPPAVPVVAVASPSVPRVAVARPAPSPMLAGARAQPPSRPAIPVLKASATPAPPPGTRLPAAAPLAPAHPPASVAVAPGPPPARRAAVLPPPPAIEEPTTIAIAIAPRLAEVEPPAVPPPPVPVAPPPSFAGLPLPATPAASSSSSGMLAFVEVDERPRRPRRAVRPIAYAIVACAIVLGGAAVATALRGGPRTDAKVPAVGISVAAKRPASPARTHAPAPSAPPPREVEPAPEASTPATAEKPRTPRPVSKPGAKTKRYEPLGI